MSVRQVARGRRRIGFTQSVDGDDDGLSVAQTLLARRLAQLTVKPICQVPTFLVEPFLARNAERQQSLTERRRNDVDGLPFVEALQVAPLFLIGLDAGRRYRRRTVRVRHGCIDN